MEVPKDTLDRIQELYDRGLYRQGYAVAEPLGPLPKWRGTAARILAGRLAGNLGGVRLGESLHLWAGRRAPDDPLARYFSERAWFVRRGAFAAWERWDRHPDVSKAEPWLQADWAAFRASVRARLRDFPAAEAELARARELAPDRPWIRVEESWVHEIADRYDDALESAQAALELRPWYRPAVHAAADALVLLGRDGEAIELLSAATAHIESCHVTGRLASLLVETGRWEEAKQRLEEYHALAPLAEPRVQEWAAGRLSDVCYALGDRAGAIAAAREAGEGFYGALAGRLEQAPADAKRVVLPVGFVRQHHMTCAPATLTTLSNYWNKPVAHLEVADAICFDGTTSLAERTWAEQQGYRAVEFRVTWNAARALLDRGIPFTMQTYQPGSAHLQAVIGYDEARGTLLIRDPSDRESHELVASPGLERYAAQGPRGTAIVPLEEAARLDGVELPDAALYDINHRLQAALERNDYAAATAAAGELDARAPGHRLTWSARDSLASFAGDRHRRLEALDGLRALYPDDPTLALVRAGYMRDQFPRQARVEWLRERCIGKDTHPAFWRQYGQELSDDGRTRPLAEMWLRKYLRYRGEDGVAWYMLANIWWRDGKRDKAAEAYRIGADLADTDEDLARARFNVARWNGTVPAALRFLQDRAARHGEKSAGPASTLAWAYRELDRTHDALRALDEGRARRRDDTALDLELAEYRAMVGDEAGAQELLAMARDRAHPVALARTEALVARCAGRMADERAAWERVREWQPGALDVQRALARLLSVAGTPADATDYLRELAREYPFHAGFKIALAEWLENDAPLEALAQLREASAIEDADDWLRREIAVSLSRAGRYEDALAEMAVARAIEPHAGPTYSVEAGIHIAAGRAVLAKKALEQALELSVDNDYAVARYCDPELPPEQLRERTAWVRERIEEQHRFGDGLWEWVGPAQQAGEPGAVLQFLQKLLVKRPDVWQVWTLLTRLHVEAGAHADALQVARRATERFPLLPRAWVDLADAHEAAGNLEGRIGALQRALQISPGWNEAIRKLGEAYEQAGQHAEARLLMLDAVARDPKSANHHGWLADACWQCGERAEALQYIQRAIELAPGYLWAWRQFDRWSTLEGEPDASTELARRLTGADPEQPEPWMWIARARPSAAPLDERLAAVDRSLALRPAEADAHDLRAALLLEAGRAEDALAACTPEVFGDEPPAELRARAAWVLGEEGRHQEAVDILTPIVEEWPSYYWAWQRLADYRERLGDLAGALEAAEAMVRIDGESAVAHGYLAHAQRLLGYDGKARASFTRAFELDPSYSFAGQWLFDYQFEAGELEAAAATIQQLHAHGQTDQYTQGRALKLALRRRDVEGGTAAARALIDDPGVERWSLDILRDAAGDRHLQPAVQAAAEQALASPEPSWTAGSLAVSAVPEKQRHAAAEQIMASQPDGSPAWRGAANQRIREFVRAKQLRGLRAFMAQHDAPLRADPKLWGLISWALLEFNKSREVVAWMSDWAARADDQLESWMLSNLAIALRNLKRWPESGAVAKRSRDLPRSSDAEQLWPWLALEQAIAGDTAGAHAVLRDLDHVELPDYLEHVLLAARAVVAVRDDPKGGFADARALLDRARRRIGDVRQFPHEAAACRRALWAVARLAASPLAWPWWLAARVRWADVKWA